MSEAAERGLDNSFERTAPAGPIPLADSLLLIRANELAQYSFCHRAWWLSTVQGVSSPQQAPLIRGIQTHRRHEGKVRAALRWRQASFFLLGGGGLLLITAVFYYFLL